MTLNNIKTIKFGKTNLNYTSFSKKYQNFEDNRLIRPIQAYQLINILPCEKYKLGGTHLPRLFISTTMKDSPIYKNNLYLLAEQKEICVKPLEIYLRNTSIDDTCLGRLFGNLGNVVDGAHTFWGLIKKPTPTFVIIDKYMVEMIHLNAFLTDDVMRCDAIYWTSLQPLPTHIVIKIDENLPQWPPITTQIVLIRKNNAGNVYVPYEASSDFFKRNNRFRYLMVTIKEAYYGSDRRTLNFKWFESSPDVFDFTQPIVIECIYDPSYIPTYGLIKPVIS